MKNNKDHLLSSGYISCARASIIMHKMISSEDDGR